MPPRLGLLLSLLMTLALLACSPRPQAQAPCQLSGSFALLQSQIPDQVGTCSGAAIDQPELGETIQPTTNGDLVYRAVDGAVSFNTDQQAWVLDPTTGQAQPRGANERFPWEFNADGLPLVGAPAPHINGPCPTAPVHVLAVENFYTSLVNQIGGQCVQTATILSDPDADPHEFQPTAGDVRAFQNAQLVVENGLGYDDFSDRILGTLSYQPALVNAGDVLGLEVGANPHVWYSAAYVDRIRAAILASLKMLNPRASDYYDAQSAALDHQFATYHKLIDQIATSFANTSVGSTESIFVDMADTTSLNVVSPAEFMDAMSEGNEATARDIAIFQNQITSHQIKVLVYNTQTVNSLTDQLVALAQQNDIPIIGVSETMPLGAQTFQGWHATELQLLLQALQKSAETSS